MILVPEMDLNICHSFIWFFSPRAFLCVCPSFFNGVRHNALVSDMISSRAAFIVLAAVKLKLRNIRGVDMDINEMLVQITGDIDTWMYTYVLLILLVAVGIYFSFKTRFVQIRFIGDMFRQVTEKKHVEGERSISSFQALMVSTASRVGTGNIAGVASAIAGVVGAGATGGAGAIFWMWAMALVGAASAFIESTCAQIWKVKDGEGAFRGGPAYYIEQAIGSRKFGVLFAILLILCFAFGFNGLQAFNACSSLEYYMPDYQTNGGAMIVGLILVLMTAAVIFGGAKRISVITSIVVPIMAFAYIAVAIWTTIIFADYIPQMFQAIFAAAFDWQAIFGGFTGSVIMLGIKRGLYSNEAGMGSAPNAAATASVSHPVKQGLVQSLSVYIDTLLICSCSAVMVCLFLVQDPETALQFKGIPLVQQAVQNSIGPIGIHFITFAIFAFAYSSLIGNYFYAESNFKFITKNKNALIVFRFLCLAAILYGAVNSFDLAWNLADIFMGLMAMMNLIVILIIGKWAILALKDYEKQKKEGKDPVFLASSIPGLPACDCWHEEHIPEIGEPVKEFFVDPLSK